MTATLLHENLIEFVLRRNRDMSDQNLSIFISYEKDKYQGPAKRLRDILQSRTDRLIVHICEDMNPGDYRQPWIADRIAASQMMLVLLLEESTDLSDLDYEVDFFRSSRPNGSIIVFKPPSVRLPDTFRDLHYLEIDVEQIRTRFLRPLYKDKEFTKLNYPLNSRVSDTELQHDAEELEKALLGFADTQTEFFCESLIVEITDLNTLCNTGKVPDSTSVRAPNGCTKILGWREKSFTWARLRDKAYEDKGKGTFWIEEMERVMVAITVGKEREVMTSTFRGRGQGVEGQIFCTQLYQAQHNQHRARYHFNFYEALVPELVRGARSIGDVFNLLYVATRARWEVLHPFVEKPLQAPIDASPLDERSKSEMMGKVSGSLRVIEAQVVRNNLLDERIIDYAFQGTERTLLLEMINKRQSIRKAVIQAHEQKDYTGFMSELAQAFALNVDVTVLLAERFLKLTREDQENIKRLLKNRNRTIDKEERLFTQINRSGEQSPEIRKPSTIRVFVSYSHQDAKYVAPDSLLGFLSSLEQDSFEFWHDKNIQTGEIWDNTIKEYIEQADIALVLVSQAFINSPYCLNVEIKRLLEKRKESGLVIFPVILSSCDWEKQT
jgi:hypothetical protein